MNVFRLYSPFWLLVIPAALAALWWRFHPRRQPAALFSSVAELKRLPVTLAQRLRRTLKYVYALGLCLIIVALARPQAGKAESRCSKTVYRTAEVAGSTQDPFANLRREREKKRGAGFEYDAFSTNKNLLA